MNIRRLLLFFLLLSLAPGCRSTVPIFEGTGEHHRAVTGSSPAAQRYFDQGLVFPSASILSWIRLSGGQFQAWSPAPCSILNDPAE